MYRPKAVTWPIAHLGSTGFSLCEVVLPIATAPAKARATQANKLLLVLLATLLATAATPPKKPAAGFSGTSALAFTHAVVSLGPRPPGTRPHAATELYIESQIKLHNAELLTDAFTAKTPIGAVPMKNIIARFRGTTGRAIVFSGHYDTKKMDGFWGANDGGSSTGFLLEMLRVLSKQKHPDDIYLVWLDGEEAFREWTASDSLYGSRHLEEKWAADGTLSHIKALINVDMIGDANLDISKEENSSKSLTKLVWDTARELGYAKYFLNEEGPVDDDHMPFVRAGVNAMDVIDLDFGPKNSFWHTTKDTMDKLSAHSLQVVGDVLMAVLKKLDAGQS
jgi:glutaminyl-peptide cyclotransferase